MTVNRPVFFVSDGTGITAETIGHSLLTQFGNVEFDTVRIAFVDSPEKALAAANVIRAAGERTGHRPIVVNSLIEANLSGLLAESGALMLDVFAPFILPLEIELGCKRQPRMGQAHGMVDFAAYDARIDATNYALTHDDGVDLDYHEADLILVGVSRSGKTPTCLYLALHYGVKAANFPLTEMVKDSLWKPCFKTCVTAFGCWQKSQPTASRRWTTDGSRKSSPRLRSSSRGAARKKSPRTC